MSKVTIYQEACNKVVGFQEMGGHFLRTLVINGRSKSTHENYLRQMAKLAVLRHIWGLFKPNQKII